MSMLILVAANNMGACWIGMMQNIKKCLEKMLAIIIIWYKNKVQVI